MAEKNLDIADRRVRDLMRQLDSVIDAETAAAHLVACGRAAIEPLRKFLLESPARSVPQPRCWAVRALAGLGAKEVLLEYRRRDEEIDDPVIRLAEESVQRAAALSVTPWRTDDVVETLITISARRLIPGVIEALGQLDRDEAVPILIYALEDDFCRPWAEAALEGVAGRYRDLLLRSALLPHPNAHEEREPSVQRRRTILLLLRRVRLTQEECHRLVALLESPDVELTVYAAAIVLADGPEVDRQRAIGRLKAVALEAPWYCDVQSLLERGSHRGDQ